MVGDEPCSSQNHDSEPVHQTLQDKIKTTWISILKERKPKIAWITLCFLIALGTVAYGFLFDNMEVEFSADEDLCTKMARSNISTETCYRRAEKETYPTIVNLCLGLLGIVLGQIIYCICNIVDELRQFERRYEKNISKLLKKCLIPGIAWKAVFLVGLLDFLAVTWMRKGSYKRGDIWYVLGSIGFSPLISYLLNLNAQTEVDRSRRNEKEGLYPGYIVAWYYYFRYLKKALKAFDECFSDSNTPAQENRENDSDVDVQPKMRLDLKKLILLFSHNCKTYDNLRDVDNCIKKIGNKLKNGYNFPVYGLTRDGNEETCVILYAKEPLKALAKMCRDKDCKAVHANERQEQVKLLYSELSKILIDHSEDLGNDECVLVLTVEDKKSSFNNGGLTELIMSKVRANECASKPEKPDGITKLATPTCRPRKKMETGMPRETSCSSTIVDIPKKWGDYIPVDSADENSALRKRDKDFQKTKHIPKTTHEVPVFVHDCPGKTIASVSSTGHAKENGRKITSLLVSGKRDEQLPTNDGGKLYGTCENPAVADRTKGTEC